MGFVYDPEIQLAKLFPSEDSLGNLDAVLDHIQKQKLATNVRLRNEIAAYKHPIDLHHDIGVLTDSFRDIRQKSINTQATIFQMTSSIQRLDTTKRNLVLSMKILKRLQMLVNAFNSLTDVVLTRDYKEIATYLGVVKELMDFFKPYKSIDEIGTLNQLIHKTQNKLVDDVFIDFEDSFTNNFTNDKLVYGCEILELVDAKYKDKLLSWFYNLQLKEIQSIFNTTDEAGNMENLSRRYIFFNNILTNIRSHYLNVFPDLWQVDLELTKLFCKVTKQDLTNQLKGSNIPSSVILEALKKSLDFEKSLNDTYKTDEFTKIILSLFEPYLTTWITEQDSLLSQKFMEFYSAPKIPSELITPQTADDLLAVLRVNSVPNFAASSVELFKTFQKLLVQIIKLSTGEILIDLSKLFAKYLREYHSKILIPILNQTNSNPKGIEPLKYLTMILNTSDYVINNTNDLQDKMEKLIDVRYRLRIDFESAKNLFFDLIGKSIKAAVLKVSVDLQFLWRQFENNGWDSMEFIADTSTYIDDFVSSLRENNRVILPLIMREGYSRTYCDRLVEMIVTTFMNKLTLIKPLSIINIEQILLDVSVLRKYFSILPHYADPNFDESRRNDETEVPIPKAYTRFLGNQFTKLETLLKLLLTPTLPVDNIVESYFNLIGDKSVPNFTKFLDLKSIEKQNQAKYIENFKLQLTVSNDLIDESPIFAVFGSEGHANQAHPLAQPTPQPVDFKDLISSKSPEPNLPDFLKTNSAKIQNIKLNNPLKDFTLNGEQHVNKFNENFKNIGKFFRKDFNDFD
ncbi:CIC11C00000002956 [Sungouiella intermedia]|uniref:CIC11C00000002956 n=1 Tax=Sungouiella intermedia TaxID=45354 RepID=A0A1L0DYN4_9ASCO|nr:CIC11C00000002956 [[Candida] intermedia]